MQTKGSSLFCIFLNSNKELIQLKYCNEFCKALINSKIESQLCVKGLRIIKGHSVCSGLMATTEIPLSCLIKALVRNCEQLFPLKSEHTHPTYGSFLKWCYPTTMGFPTKNDPFGSAPIFGMLPKDGGGSFENDPLSSIGPLHCC